MSDRINHLFEKVKAGPKLKLGVVCPESEQALQGAVLIAEDGMAEPILVGSRVKIEKVAKSEGIDLTPFQIVDVATEEESAMHAVKMASKGELDALMKGSLHSNTFMASIVSREGGLRMGRRMSHVMLVDAPAYHKLLVYSDVALNIFPGLPEKKDIVQNAIDFSRSLGVKTPKVALLSCVDTISDKIPNTQIDGELLALSEQGEFKDAILEGPIQFDAAISKEVAQTKGMTSKIAGDTDILIFPDLEAGNIAVKQAELFGKAECYGIIVGVRAPVILTSRAATVESRRGSCLIAKLYADYCKTLT